MADVVTTTHGARIGQVLDSLDFTEPGFRSLDAGDQIIAPAPDGKKSALQIITELVQSNRGVFYINRGGTAVFEDRDRRSKRTTSSGTITSAVVRSDTSFDIESLKNRVTVQRVNPATGSEVGSAQTAQNDASVATYGVSDAEQITTAYLSPQTDANALGLAQYVVNIRNSWKRPIEVELHGQTDAMLAFQLSCELQDRVTVSNSQASGDWHIERIRHKVTPESWITTLTLSDRGTEAIVFDVSVFDGTTERLGL